MSIIKPKSQSLLTPGHRGCAGCGQLLAARLVINACGPNTIISNATGCLEVVTTAYPESAWRVPWIHSLFENAAPIGSGILAGLKFLKKSDKINILVLAGDGGTFDIGYGLLSGMWERGENILYVCLDNEAYENTGNQASGATPYAASSSTAPAGKQSIGSVLQKKNMPQLAIDHGVPYAATSTVAFPLDIQAKVKKALTMKGPKYLQILVPCVPGWGIEPNLTIKLARQAQQTGLYPVFEAENGRVTKIMSYPKNPPKVEEYLRPQKRFKHLFNSEKGEKVIKEIQSAADENMKVKKLSL
ncbi:MAG: thiamine pyrophosphate-dependent enzyme [bacterium]